MRAPLPSPRASASPVHAFGLRALVLAALAVGESRIEALPDDAAVAALAAALRSMGASVDRVEGIWRVRGVGTGSLVQPDDVLAVESDTAAALLLGLAASQAITVTLAGPALLDSDLLAALGTMGADITASPGGCLPLMVRGLCPAVPLARDVADDGPLAWALLVAGLNAPGETRLRLPDATTFDTTLLAAFGVPFDWIGTTLVLRGEAELRPAVIRCPAAA
ncbi:hypothetical protein ACBY01_02550 [Sphingomonas sp. ac-8]|uniref:hypothetical protein n=1 Tax=Sphingomonas sp. ac-8 TaxID=3242977 RepID=UPI003A80C1AF